MAMGNKMIYRHYNGNQYVIEITDNPQNPQAYVKVNELVDLPGTNDKGLAKMDIHEQNAVWFMLVEDLAMLSGRDVDDVLDFFLGEQ
jgi:hypothetical protein